MAFNYAISGVFDLDQRWDALPGNGSMYCVPTSATNWMYYYATHGHPNALRYHAPAYQNHIPLNIGRMGNYMDTDAEDGTSSSDALEGLADWLNDRNLPAFLYGKRAPDNGSLTYINLRNMLQENAQLIVVMGRYRREDGEFERRSGHAMSLVSLKRTDDGKITIGVHDPAQDDGNINAQSGFVVKNAALTEGFRNIEGDVVKVLRWGTDTSPYRFIDGYKAILPWFFFTNLTAGALTRYSADIKTGEITTKQFPLPFNGEIVDLALDPPMSRASVIARGSGEVWTLDVAEGSWSKTGGVSGAQLITYGGRRESLFVVQGREIKSFDEEGRPLGRFDAGVSVDAVSYDQKNDRLVVASSAAKRLLAVAPGLQVLGQAEAPDVPGSGRLSLSVNGRDATILLTRQGSPEAATVRWHATGALATGRFRLLAQGPTSAAHINRKGRIYVSEAGKVAAFDTDGNRVTASVFDGLRAGPLLKVARSSYNLDEARSRRKEWKN
ncbi:MAG TPA: hypothetical protein VD861_15290 [Pyrinomonadaceae bacterium]|nr:hypothetical protein [Pyrinomonadaceae bacterium]